MSCPSCVLLGHIIYHIELPVILILFILRTWTNLVIMFNESSCYYETSYRCVWQFCYFLFTFTLLYLLLHFSRLLIKFQDKPAQGLGFIPTLQHTYKHSLLTSILLLLPCYNGHIISHSLIYTQPSRGHVLTHTLASQ